MKWKEFVEQIESFDAFEICMIAEVDAEDNMISKIYTGDTRGDGLSDKMFKECFDCEEELEVQVSRMKSKSGRIFNYIIL